MQNRVNGKVRKIEDTTGGLEESECPPFSSIGLKTMGALRHSVVDSYSPVQVASKEEFVSIFIGLQRTAINWVASLNRNSFHVKPIWLGYVALLGSEPMTLAELYFLYPYEKEVFHQIIEELLEAGLIMPQGSQMHGLTDIGHRLYLTLDVHDIQCAEHPPILYPMPVTITGTLHFLRCAVLIHQSAYRWHRHAYGTGWTTGSMLHIYFIAILHFKPSTADEFHEMLLVSPERISVLLGQLASKGMTEVSPGGVYRLTEVGESEFENFNPESNACYEFMEKEVNTYGSFF